MTKIDLESLAGRFLPCEGETCFKSMDGSDVAIWLEKNGEPVLRFFDTGRNGLALTKSGYAVSTNGYVYKAPLKYKNDYHK